MRRNARKLLIVPVLAMVSGFPAACRNPLGSRPDDYGLVVEPDRLRSAPTLDFSQRALPEEPFSEHPQREARPDPFAGLQSLDVTIEQCRVWTLSNNLNLSVALMDPAISASGLSEEEARFESAFTARIAGSDADGPRALVFDRDVDPFSLEPGVRVPLRTGGDAFISIPIAQNERFGGQDPAGGRYSTDIEVGFIQPLLRGGGRRAATHPIRIASLESQAVQARTKLEVIRQIAAVDRQYWLTYQAKQLLQVRQEQFEHAKAQLERAEARFHEKIGPEIEVWRAEAGLARRLESIIIAENLLRDRQRTLKRIINAPGADVDSSVVLVLSSKPDLVRYNFDPAELLAQSLDQRAELLEQELRLAQAASTIDFERNGALPLATLDYVYRIDGSGDRLGRAFSSAAEIESQGWAVGLNLEVPLGNEAAQSRVHRAILTRLQRLATREARRQEVKQEVLSALDNLDLTWQRIVAARQNVIVEERNYRGEQGQYQLGLRNSTEVLDAETRLADAKASFINAIVDYQVAQVDLAFATGMLLGAAKVSW